MRPFALHRMQVVRKEDKENKLKSFINKILQNTSINLPDKLELTVLARACDSPVLKALLMERDRLQELSCHIRIVVVNRDPEATRELQAFLKEVSSFVGSDARLLDAHEQLTIGQSCSWIGDCMRREPSKRDAYECYSEECRETSAYALKSFDRVWNHAQFVSPQNTGLWKDIKHIPNEVDLKIYEISDEVGNSTISTRH